jgi:hypothetical protein
VEGISEEVQLKWRHSSPGSPAIARGAAGCVEGQDPLGLLARITATMVAHIFVALRLGPIRIICPRLCVPLHPGFPTGHIALWKGERLDAAPALRDG